MPRNWSEAIPEGNGPVRQQEKFGSDPPTLADVYRRIEELFDRPDTKSEKLAKVMRATEQRLAGQEQNARQPCLAMEADAPADTKTRQRTDGAAKAIQAMYGNCFSAKRVDPDPMCLTSFGVKAETPVLPCRNYVLIENGAAAPKSCLSPLEMCSSTATDGLLPAGMASTATSTIFNQPTLWFCLTKETNSRKSTQYALYYNINFW